MWDMKTETRVIIIGAIITVLLVIGAAFLLSKGEEVNVSKEQIISRTGIHWHPKLTILIKGKKQEIPANIGIAGQIHQEIHTHEKDGVLHMEMAGIVTKDETKLQNFFRIWGKEFNSNCIFDKCNGSEGNVKMTVNSQENPEFENYLMKDKDKIEIKYE